MLEKKFLVALREEQVIFLNIVRADADDTKVTQVLK